MTKQENAKILMKIGGWGNIVNGTIGIICSIALIALSIIIIVSTQASAASRQYIPSSSINSSYYNNYTYDTNYVNTNYNLAPVDNTSVYVFADILIVCATLGFIFSLICFSAGYQTKHFAKKCEKNKEPISINILQLIISAFTLNLLTLGFSIVSLIGISKARD